MFSDSKVTKEFATVCDGKLMPSPGPAQFVKARARGAPDALGVQTTSAANARLGASVMPAKAIAAPATIGSRIIRARERLTLDALLRRLLRSVSSTERRSMS